MNTDPRLAPDTANVFDHDTHQTYARRTTRTVFGVFLVVFLIAMFVGWFFFSGDEDEVERFELTQQASEDVQMPGNEYEEGTGRSGVYDFFYKVFGGIEDGLENNPHNLENVEELKMHNIDTAELFGDDVSANVALKQAADVDSVEETRARDDGYRHSVFDIVGSKVNARDGEYAGQVFDIFVHKESGQAQAIIVRDDDSRYGRALKARSFKRVYTQESDGDTYLTVGEETVDRVPEFEYSEEASDQFVSLRRLREGQLIDFEGKVAGEIDAIIYQNAEVQSLYFTLRPVLAERGFSKFKLPFSEIEVVENPDGLDIQLTKEQTQALAEALLGDE